MTFKVPVSGSVNWFCNSWRWVDDNYDFVAIEAIDEKFESEFNVKLIEEEGQIVGVTFPSEDDAMMFLLRWS